MTVTPRRWNSSKILRVGGTFARQGVYTGHSPDLSPDGSPTFKTSTFTSNILQRINDNFKGSVPIYVGNHGYGNAKRPQVGRSFKVGLSETKDEISHEGYVWDEDGQKKIAEEGYDKVSPEFDMKFDSQGNIEDVELTGIVYVKNPAISGTSNQAVAMCFSQGPSEFIMTGEQNPQNPPPAQPPANNAPPAQPPAQPPADPPVLPPAKPPVTQEKPQAPPVEPPVPPAAPANSEVQKKIQYVLDPTLVSKLKDVEEKLAKYESVIPGIVAQNEAIKVQQLGDIASDLKQLGVDSPEALVEGFSTDNKIKALTQFKERLVKAAPMIKGPNDLQTRLTRAEQDKAMFTQALTEIGLSDEIYTRVMNGGKII
jgi:hypothetical protein